MAYLGSLVIFFSTLSVTVMFNFVQFTFDFTRIMWLLHIPSLLLIGLPTLGFVNVIIPLKGVKWRMILNPEPSHSYQEAERLCLCLHHMGNIALIMGAVGALIGLPIVLLNFDNPPAIGPAMGVLIISMLYAMGLKILVYTAEARVTQSYQLSKVSALNIEAQWSIYVYPLFCLIAVLVVWLSIIHHA